MSRGSGWIAASTVFASTRSTSISTRQGLENNPALPPQERNDQTAPAVNPYNFQDHVYDKSRPENLKFLERFRAVLDEYPAAASVGEVGDSQRGLEVVAAYTAGGDRVHMCYAFDFLAPEKISAGSVKKVLEDFGRVASDGWACWAFSNHDVMRHATRWGAGEEDRDAYLKVVSALLMSLRGSVCLYQGEELGLGEAELTFEDLQDPYGIRFWPEFKGRDGCRTPMVWENGAQNGGFSSAKPWLPVPHDHLARAVDKQAGRPGFDAGALSPFHRIPAQPSGVRQRRYRISGGRWRRRRLHAQRRQRTHRLRFQSRVQAGGDRRRRRTRGDPVRARLCRQGAMAARSN